MAVAFHSQRLKIAATIVMPLFAPLIKVTRVRQYGARELLHGNDYDTAFAEAQRMSDGDFVRQLEALAANRAAFVYPIEYLKPTP